jgi:hypothetical protein
MSMNWVGCLNHILHHNPSEKPRESPTNTASDCETQNLARPTKKTCKFSLVFAQHTLGLLLWRPRGCGQLCGWEVVAVMTMAAAS